MVLSMAGDIGVAHKSRGKAESGRIDDKARSKVLELYHEKHWDFGPTALCHKFPIGSVEVV